MALEAMVRYNPVTMKIEIFSHDDLRRLAIR
jgi:hypothetical protein